MRHDDGSYTIPNLLNYPGYLEYKLSIQNTYNDWKLQKLLKVLRILTKIHHYRLPILGVCGTIMTIVLSNPGNSLATVGPLSVDMFWVSLAVFGILMLSVPLLGAYDPEEYGLED